MLTVDKTTSPKLLAKPVLVFVTMTFFICFTNDNLDFSNSDAKIHIKYITANILKAYLHSVYSLKKLLHFNHVFRRNFARTALTRLDRRRGASPLFTTSLLALM